MIRSLIAIALIAFACNGKTQQKQETESIAKRVELNEFNKIITDENVQLVDVRTPGEYAGGFIDDAVNIDFTAGGFVEACTSQLDKDKPVAIYCAAGGRSAKALKQLKDAGFSEVYELGVGYNGYAK